MTKSNCPTSLHGVTERAFAQIGTLDDVLAVLPDRKKYQLYDASDADRDPQKAYKLTLTDVRALTRAGATAFAEDLARLCGMQLVPIGGTGAPVPVEFMNRLSQLMSETGEAVSTGAMAIADGKLDRNEIRAVRAQVIDVLSAGNSLLKDMDTLEGGV